MKTGGFLVLGGLAGLAGCSFDTASLVDGGPDVPRDTGNDLAPDTVVDTGIDAGVDVPVDEGFDVPVDRGFEVGSCRNDVPAGCSDDAGTADVPTTDGGFTMLGRWRIVSGSLASIWTLTDTGPSRINGLARATTQSLSIGTTLVSGDRTNLAHEGFLPATCPMPFRTSDSNAGGMLGHMDGPTRFTVTLPATSTMMTFAEMGGRLQVTIPTGVLDLNTVAILERFVPPEGSMVRNGYGSMCTVFWGDGTCPASQRTTLTAPHLALLWEHPCTGVGVPIGTPRPITAALSSAGWIDTVPLLLADAPPTEVRQMIYGGEVAIAYLVVFDDSNGNHLFEHPWTGGATAVDQVWGISNQAIVWRGPPVPSCGEDHGSFIDTYQGYQLVTLGADFRSDGGSAPWLVLGGVAAHVGAFPEDPTHPNPPSIAIQAGPIPAMTALPRLLR
jgi:hypothetical protein